MDKHKKKNDQPVFPIQTAAKLLNISEDELKIYEQKRLIIPSKILGNQELFTFKDILKLNRIIKDQKEKRDFTD
ncbi:MAG: MerR family transcriptional regulator [Ignavibacteriae bacterium]|nr:MerR family transcriptional regulator [Ignavibacteriota bacterium]